jgi:hypothetical protein
VTVSADAAALRDRGKAPHAFVGRLGGPCDLCGIPAMSIVHEGPYGSEVPSWEQDRQKSAADAYRDAWKFFLDGLEHPDPPRPESCYLKAMATLALWEFRERYGIAGLVRDLHEPQTDGGERRETRRADDPLADAFADLPPGASAPGG